MASYPHLRLATPAGKLLNDAQVLSEVSLFFLMPIEEGALKGLAEYILFRQARADADVAWLSRTISEAVIYDLHEATPELGIAILGGYFEPKDWRKLLDWPPAADIEGYSEMGAWSEPTVCEFLIALSALDQQSRAETLFAAALSSLSDDQLTAILGFFEGVANSSLPRNLPQLRDWIYKHKRDGTRYGDLITASIIAEQNDGALGFHKLFVVALEIRNRRFPRMGN